MEGKVAILDLNNFKKLRSWKEHVEKKTMTSLVLSRVTY